MRKVILNMKESKKYEVIKQLVDKGESSAAKNRAAVKLSCSRRTIDRLIVLYKSEGKEGFIHHNRNRPPATRFDDETRRKIIDLYINDYPDANISHFNEIVEEEMNIGISDETIRLWLIEEKIVSPKSHRITRKRIKKRCKEELKKARSHKEENELKEKIEEMERKDVHPRRERKKYMGEMIQMDASEHEWIKGQVWTLHLAIDDASGKVVGAYFDYEETLYGYYQTFKQILMNYGIPSLLYTDKRTVFEYKRKSRPLDDEDSFTQFSYACHNLGVEIKTTSVAQAKGRIERLNGTFQSRLPVELRRANVTTIEQANIFLQSYLEKYNEQFSLQLNTTRTVFVKQPTERVINDTLTIRSVRTIDHGHTIHYHNKIYTPATRSGNRIYLQEGMKAIMVETLDGRLMINVFDEMFYAKEVNKHEDISKDFDYEESKKLIPYSWSLPKKKSRRIDDFLGFLAKQKHRQDISV